MHNTKFRVFFKKGKQNRTKTPQNKQAKTKPTNQKSKA